jgi:hypothetical protein
MTRAGWGLVLALLMAPLTGSIAAQEKPAAAAGPVLVVETVKGTVEIELYPADAPKTVAHITALVKRNFYNGLRVHRVVPDFVVQFGDPLTRDMTKKQLWGTGGSGRVVGVAETKRTHKLGGDGARGRPGQGRFADVHPAAKLGDRARRQVRRLRAGDLGHGGRAEDRHRRHRPPCHAEALTSHKAQITSHNYNRRSEAQFCDL